MLSVLLLAGRLHHDEYSCFPVLSRYMYHILMHHRVESDIVTLQRPLATKHQ
jgi:hypothetical protein